MDAEFARAEEEERRLNAGEALEPAQQSAPKYAEPSAEHTPETQAQDDELGLIHRDDRNTPLQEPSSSHEPDDEAQPNKPNP